MAALQAQNEKAIDAIMADARAAYSQLPPPKEAGA